MDWAKVVLPEPEPPAMQMVSGLLDVCIKWVKLQNQKEIQVSRISPQLYKIPVQFSGDGGKGFA
jgi:hypothetical protein